MTPPAQLLTLEALEAWAQAKQPGEVVGYTCSLWDCPLATYCHEDGYDPATWVGRFEVTLCAEGRTLASLPLPDPLYGVRVLVDSDPRHSPITAARLVRFIHAARDGTDLPPYAFPLLNPLNHQGAHP